MSVSKSIRGLLRKKNKSYIHLADYMNIPADSANAKLSRGIIDDQTIKAIAILADVDISEVKRVIEEGKIEEGEEASLEGKIREYDDKVRNLELNVQILNEKIKSYSNSLEEKEKHIKSLEEQIQVLKEYNAALKKVARW